MGITLIRGGGGFLSQMGRKTLIIGNALILLPVTNDSQLESREMLANKEEKAVCLSILLTLLPSPLPRPVAIKLINMKTFLSLALGFGLWEGASWAGLRLAFLGSGLNDRHS